MMMMMMMNDDDRALDEDDGDGENARANEGLTRDAMPPRAVIRVRARREHTHDNVRRRIWIRRRARPRGEENRARLAPRCRQGAACGGAFRRRARGWCRYAVHDVDFATRDGRKH